jgi:hypothetical protein
VFETEIAAVSEEAQKITGVFSSGNQQDFVNTGIHESLDRVIHHRLVVDWQQMLVRHSRERIQPASRATRKHNAFHIGSPVYKN